MQKRLYLSLLQVDKRINNLKEVALREFKSDFFVESSKKKCYNLSVNLKQFQGN